MTTASKLAAMPSGLLTLGVSLPTLLRDLGMARLRLSLPGLRLETPG